VATLILCVAGGYLLVCLALFMLQPALIFVGGGPPDLDPGDVGLEYTEVALETADGLELHGWYVPAAGASAVVLVCHGNAGNVGDRLGLLLAFHRMGLAVLLFDYRGYGNSEGRTTEAGTYRDAEAAWRYLTGVRGLAPERIVAFGESLGGAVAIELARRRPLGLLIVESTFTSVPDMGARLYPWAPVRLLCRIRYDSLAKVGALTLPKLFLHSPEDEIVPYESGRRLFEAAAEPKEFCATAGGHNDGGFVRSAVLEARVRSFLDRWLGAGAAPPPGGGRR
jgi:fermentation-respiration switch protein FrsA (DUF1100 family)